MKPQTSSAKSAAPAHGSATIMPVHAAVERVGNVTALSSRSVRRRKRGAPARRPAASASTARHECSCELLILPDGGIITHNLTPAVAALLKETLGV